MKGFSKKKKTFVLIVFLILIVFILNLFQKEVRNFFYTVSAPIQKVLWGAGDRVSDFFGSFIKANNLKRERDELMLKNQELLTQAAVSEEIKRENEVLRQALEIGFQKDFKLALAQIIGKDISQDFILIDKGFKDGILKDMPVITQQKVLVGKINEVYDNFSKVMLISNEKSSFDAKIQKQEKDISGVIKGEGNFKILFDFIPREEEILPGDIIITSSLAGIFPEGLLVGEVKEIEKSDVEAFQKAEIKPSFDISESETLFIILDF